MCFSLKPPEQLICSKDDTFAIVSVSLFPIELCCREHPAQDGGAVSAPDAVSSYPHCRALTPAPDLHKSLLLPVAS